MNRSANPLELKRHTMKASTISAYCCMILLTACSGTPPLQSSERLTAVQNEPMPAPTRADLTPEGQIYTIGPFDELDVVVFSMPELSMKVRVDASGTVALPLAGTVEASGSTAQELAVRIESALRERHVRNPQVAVNISDVVSQTVTVDGEVRLPGAFPLVGRSSLLRVIAKAQGTNQYAKLTHVTVYRTVEGRDYAALYDVRAIRQGLYDDPDIYANDVVIVGTSQARRLFGDVVAATGLISVPLTLLLR